MRYILHSDLNNFYASVECMLNPNIRNKAVVVVGDVEKRHGIVLAKNYVAKGYGIKTGDTVWEAKNKCLEELVTVPTHFDMYYKISGMVKDIYREYSDRVESFGIDEAWIDISHLASSDDEAVAIANKGGNIGAYTQVLKLITLMNDIMNEYKEYNKNQA